MIKIISGPPMSGIWCWDEVLLDYKIRENGWLRIYDKEEL